MDEWETSEKSKKIPMKTAGVGPCLALAITCVDLNGVVQARGMGHFSALNLSGYNKINKLMNAVKSIPVTPCHMNVFAAGLYDKDTFGGIKNFIESNYSIEKFEFMINPWNLPKDICEKTHEQDCGRYYIDETSFGLQVALTENGQIYVADDSTGDNINGFFQFDKEDFDKWKTSDE